jgi:hypothetical protein
MLRKGEESPVMDTLETKPTTERNGTQIKISIKNYEDERKFRDECKKQLAYFDNVYFGDSVHIANRYTILQGENWIVSSNGTPFSGLHLCLGKVAYPIDWDNLGVTKIECNAALKFEIGELDVIQTREDVRYTPKTKAAIKDAISRLEKEIINKWESEKSYEIDDIIEYYRIKGKPAYVSYTSSDTNFNFAFKLSSILRGRNYDTWKFTPFDEVGLAVPQNFSNCFLEYKVTAKVTNGGHRKMDTYTSPHYLLYTGSDHRKRDLVMYRLVGDHNPKKSKYIREELEGGVNQVYIVRNVKTRLAQYRHLLKLKDDEKHLWRKQIMAFQKVMREIMLDRTKSYKSVVVDPEWLKAQRNPRISFDRKKFVINLTYGHGWDKARWVKGNIDKATRTLFICGVEDQKNDLHAIGRMFSEMYPNKLAMIGDSSGSHLRVGYVAPSNLKYLENVKNLITVGTFHDSKPFKRCMTAYHVRTMKKYKDILKVVDSYDSTVWDNVYEPISKIMHEARQYMDINGVYKNEDDFKHETIIKSGYALIKEQDAFDYDFMEKLDLIGEYIANIPLLMTFLDMLITDNDGYSYIEDVFRESTERENIAREIVKAIVMHNCYMPKKQRKKINGYYHVLLRTNEMSWLSKEDREFIKYIQRPKLKFV